MLKSLLRYIFINISAVYLSLQMASPAVTLYGDYKSLFFVSLLLILGNVVVKPLVNLFLLPFHLVTLGLFRWMANFAVVYLITWLIPGLKIHSFISPPLNLNFLLVPPIHFSVFGSFILFTITITLTFHFLYWLLSD
jgi:putative membrane protein